VLDQTCNTLTLYNRVGVGVLYFIIALVFITTLILAVRLTSVPQPRAAAALADRFGSGGTPVVLVTDM
jgi:hypothetical protein